MQISRNGLILHLSENKRFTPGVIILVESKETNKLYSDLKRRKLKVVLHKPEKTNWQTIQMEIEDPFGNLLRFNETIVE